MDAAAHYRHLLGLGRDEFLAAAAPAVLVRHRFEDAADAAAGLQTLTMDLDEEATDGRLDRSDDRAAEHGIGAADDTRPQAKLTPEMGQLELYPLAKKLGASFPDRITIGRTPNNDVEIADHSVSRLHAYVRQVQARGWVVADAGSKNGSWLDDLVLAPRREATLRPGGLIRLGDVVLTFYRSEDLFDLLGDDHDRR